VTLDARASSGAVSNVEAIQRGTADVGFTFADLAYVAFNTGLAGSPRFDRLRAVATLQLTPVHLVVGAHSGIDRVDALRGRRVGVGMPGSGTALTAELVLGMFGIPLSALDTEGLPFDEAARRVADGSLDAMFDAAIYPVDAVRFATAAGARLLPISGAPVDHLRREYPFFAPTVIPRRAYAGVATAVHTIGIESVLVCRRDLPEMIVYALTEQFFSALPSLSASLEALRFMDLAESPATPIPLHDGAARYFRERELLR
jgi:TRAP transporter TAXI family solute receptor